MAKHDAPVRWVAWGTFEVGGQLHARTEEGRTGAGKDIRVVAGEVTAWKERKGHLLKRSMITGVFGLEIETLVIGNGVEGAIDCSEKLIRSIRERGIDNVIVQRTPEACQTYNALRKKGVRAALLAHGTC